jgi:Acetyltransferase (GNAT) family
VGRIVLKRNWNKYTYVEDIKVDKQYRGYGVGKKLIEQAKRWMKDGGMTGIMLETQNNNVRACNFYESCGFVIGGFDSCVYRGPDKDSDEIAIYLYLMLDSAKSSRSLRLYFFSHSQRLFKFGYISYFVRLKIFPEITSAISRIPVYYFIFNEHNVEVLEGTDQRTRLVRRKSTGLVDLDNAYPVGTTKRGPRLSNTSPLRIFRP